MVSFVFGVFPRLSSGANICDEASLGLICFPVCGSESLKFTIFLSDPTLAFATPQKHDVFQWMMSTISPQLSKLREKHHKNTWHHFMHVLPRVLLHADDAAVAAEVAAAAVVVAAAAAVVVIVVFLLRPLVGDF